MLRNKRMTVTSEKRQASEQTCHHVCIIRNHPSCCGLYQLTGVAVLPFPFLDDLAAPRPRLDFPFKGLGALDSVGYSVPIPDLPFVLLLLETEIGEADSVGYSVRLNWFLLLLPLPFPLVGVGVGKSGMQSSSSLDDDEPLELDRVMFMRNSLLLLCEPLPPLLLLSLVMLKVL